MSLGAQTNCDSLKSLLRRFQPLPDLKNSQPAELDTRFMRVLLNRFLSEKNNNKQ
jgi:hypothetical protein